MTGFVAAAIILLVLVIYEAIEHILRWSRRHPE